MTPWNFNQLIPRRTFGHCNSDDHAVENDQHTDCPGSKNRPVELWEFLSFVSTTSFSNANISISSASSRLVAACSFCRASTLSMRRVISARASSIRVSLESSYHCWTVRRSSMRVDLLFLWVTGSGFSVLVFLGRGVKRIGVAAE